jgi:hypothetical protein
MVRLDVSLARLASTAWKRSSGRSSIVGATLSTVARAVA